MERDATDVLAPVQLQAWLAASFANAGITSLDLLKDDRRVETAALTAYKLIPLVPTRELIKTTIGRDGFVAFVFRARDKMLESRTTEFSWLTLAELKSLWKPSDPSAGPPQQPADSAAPHWQDEARAKVAVEMEAELELPRSMPEPGPAQDAASSVSAQTAGSAASAADARLYGSHQVDHGTGSDVQGTAGERAQSHDEQQWVTFFSSSDPVPQITLSPKRESLAPERTPARVRAGESSSPAGRSVLVRTAVIGSAVVLAVLASSFLFLEFKKGKSTREVPPSTPSASTSRSASSPSSAEGEGAAPAQPPADHENRIAAAPSSAAGEPYSPEGSTRKLRSGKVIYASSCKSCHGTGASGAPRLDDVEAWRSRLARSTASLAATVIQGKGAMPARGGDRSLQDEEIRRAVEYMVADAKKSPKQPAVASESEAPPPAPQSTLPSEPPSTSAAPAAATEPWLASLRADLARCEQLNAFERVFCSERARWNYCAPNRWNSVPECAVKTPNASPGS